jgi:hypothetical protein
MSLSAIALSRILAAKFSVDSLCSTCLTLAKCPLPIVRTSAKIFQNCQSDWRATASTGPSRSKAGFRFPRAAPSDELSAYSCGGSLCGSLSAPGCGGSGSWASAPGRMSPGLDGGKGDSMLPLLERLYLDMSALAAAIDRHSTPLLVWPSGFRSKQTSIRVLSSDQVRSSASELVSSGEGPMGGGCEQAESPRTANLLRGSGPGKDGHRPHSKCSKCSCTRQAGAPFLSLLCTQILR